MFALCNLSPPLGATALMTLLWEFVQTDGVRKWGNLENKGLVVVWEGADKGREIETQ